MPIGTIKELVGGTWGSGIFTLVLEVDGRRAYITAENGPTVRALAAIFPNVILPGHRVNVAALEGQQIQFEVDEIGLLTSIAEVES